MTRHRLTGSRIELADAGCLYWARPDVALPARTESAASALGSATHEAAQISGETAPDRTVDEEELEDALRDAATSSWVGGAECVPVVAAKWGLTPSATEALSELYEAWYAWWREFVPDGASILYEVPYAWDTTTWQARQLPSKGPRDYSDATWSEVTCTLDAVIRGVDGSVTVVDLKTGRRRHRPASEHAQLAMGAMCVAGVTGAREVRVVLAKIQPGHVYVDEATLDVLTLDTRALSLAAHVLAIDSAEPVPGTHCSALYCPAIAVCEGPRALAGRVPELARALSVAIETEAHAAAALLAVKPLQAFVDELKRGAVAWAETHGGSVRMPDGSVMRRTPQPRRTVDPDLALPVLRRELGVTAEDLIKTRRSVSVAAIERAASAACPQGRKRVEVDTRRRRVSEVMAAIEATGGVKVSSYNVWESDEAKES